MTTRDLGQADPRNTRAGDGVTDKDRQTLEDYADRLTEAVELLRQEIAAIKDGKLEVVNMLYPKKAELLKWIEMRAPLVEPFLTKPAAQEVELPAKLASFKTALQEDGELLERMSGVAASIAREIQKVLNRDSLDGLYGKSGQKLASGNDVRLKLDKQI